MAFCQKCGANIGDMKFCVTCDSPVQHNESKTMPADSYASIERNCIRCGAALTEGSCEYCGWYSAKPIPNKTLTLAGLLHNLRVTRETCTFTPKIGSPLVIANKEISKISLSQAQGVGTGELSLFTVTGITQKVTFISTQNSQMAEIVSYLLHVAPNAEFFSTKPLSTEAKTASMDINGVACPKCKSRETKMTGKNKRYRIWRIFLGLLLIWIGYEFIDISVKQSNSTGLIIIVFFVAGGLALVMSGLGIIGRKKPICICMNCRKRFTV